MVVMCLFGEELVALLLRTGKFDHDSTVRVASALRVYGFALLGNASVRLFSTAFFALGDTRTPFRMQVLALDVRDDGRCWGVAAGLTVVVVARGHADQRLERVAFQQGHRGGDGLQ